MDDRIERYVQALCAELRMLRERIAPLQPSVTVGEVAVRRHSARLRPSIFFGGGTPTMLSVAQFERVLAAADAIVPIAAAEVSTEANPGTVLEPGYLRDLRKLGINRLSMGVQSLHDPTLRVLGRIHTAEEARRSYLDARAAGFDSINLDFIFGLPGQDLDQWIETLRTVAAWEVDHFALYSLILEERTPLYAQVTAGRVTVPDDDTTGAMYEAAISELGAAGYHQYEISNWARGPISGEWPRHACQHNLAYWLNSDFVAAGAGAHGHIFPERYYNILGIDEYIAAVETEGLPIAEHIPLAASDLYAETMFMGLRLNAGVRRDHFAARCGVALDSVYRETLDRLIARGLLEDLGEVVRLSERGRMLGNQVFAEFV